MLARLNRHRSTKGDAAEIARLSDTAASSSFHRIYLWMPTSALSGYSHSLRLAFNTDTDAYVGVKFLFFTSSGRSVSQWCIDATMESTDHAAEADPLKRGEDGADTGTATELKKKSCKEGLGFAKLTHWRTAVFFLSLFLCLTIVFAFSFIIPCPVRPQYLGTWKKTVPEAGVCITFFFTSC